MKRLRSEGLHNILIGLIRLTFSVLILVLLFSRVNFLLVFNQIRNTNIPPLLVSIILAFFIRYIWAYQMSFGIKPMGLNVTTVKIFKIRLIASFYSLFLPGNLIAGGISWYKLKKPSGKGIESGLLLFYFNIVNILSLFIIGIGAIWLDEQFLNPDVKVFLLFILLLLLVIFLPFMLPLFNRHIEIIFSLIIRYFPKSDTIQSKVKIVKDGLISFQSLRNKDILIIFILAFVAQFLDIINFYLLTKSVHIELEIPVVGWIRTVVSMVQMLPVSIAGIGVRELSLVYLLKHYGVIDAQAISYSLVIFSVTVLIGIVGGLLEGYDWIQGVRLPVRISIRNKKNDLL